MSREKEGQPAEGPQIAARGKAPASPVKPKRVTSTARHPSSAKKQKAATTKKVTLPRTDLGLGPVQAQLTKRGTALRHAKGIDHIRERFPAGVVHILAAGPMTWEVLQRFDDGTISAKPVPEEPLRTELVQLMDRIKEA